MKKVLIKIKSRLRCIMIVTNILFFCILSTYVYIYGNGEQFKLNGPKYIHYTVGKQQLIEINKKNQRPYDYSETIACARSVFCFTAFFRFFCPVVVHLISDHCSTVCFTVRSRNKKNARKMKTTTITKHVK